MANKRADGKKNFGGYILAALHDRVTAAAGRLKVTNTDVLNEALTDWLEKHETPETTGEPT